MASSNDPAKISRCTTCTFKEDFSNYWTAVLYFWHANGSFKRVPQMPGQYLGNPNGGMSIYYIQPTNGQHVTAFKKVIPSLSFRMSSLTYDKGFRMIVRDAMVRTMNTSSPEATSLNFRCLDANYGNGGVVGAPGTDSNALPTQPCAGGIRSQIVFPACWDGINLDSPDHKSHVAYPTNGACSSIHPVALPQLFIETIWDTRQFNSMWPSNGKQPFVYSMGDPIGVAQHADYAFGWDGDSLQRAIDACTDSSGQSCPVLTGQTDAQINACTQQPRVAEAYEGWLPALPGCNPIQPGPARATMASDCGAPTTWIGSDPAAAPPSPATTAVPPPTTPAPGAALQTHYGQCGGSGYTGPTTCQSPYTCQFSNDWYSQCLEMGGLGHVRHPASKSFSKTGEPSEG
ncbi:unnamed protein product [Cyclocybe aegerita]|uniref:CBM1 domain-containing protein n=1 Tax=Cyclocybe aegerita TaxID=1973307 RepID=A0A8S0WC27_CYCAE|nr:unnamed protein product [Cyclocybe aegerita]